MDNPLPTHFLTAAKAWVEHVQIILGESESETLSSIMAYLELYRQQRISIYEVLKQTINSLSHNQPLLTDLLSLFPPWILAELSSEADEDIKRALLKCSKSVQSLPPFLPDSDCPCNEASVNQNNCAQLLHKQADIHARDTAHHTNINFASNIAQNPNKIGLTGVTCKCDTEIASIEELLFPDVSKKIFSQEAKKSLVKLLLEIQNHLFNASCIVHIIKFIKLYLSGIVSLNEALVAIQPVFPMHITGLCYRFKRCLLSLGCQAVVPLFSQQKITALAQPMHSAFATGSYYTILQDQISPNNTPLENASVLMELNKKYVSIPRGSEDDSDRKFKRNLSEDIMFTVENEMFELDVQIGRAEALAETLQSVLNNPKNVVFDGEPFLSILDLKTLAIIYGPNAQDIVNSLRRIPTTAIEALKISIEKKIYVWKTTRLHLFNSSWKEKMEKNFYKQFDQILKGG